MRLTTKPEWPVDANAPVRRVITWWREPTVGPEIRVQLARAGKPITFARLMLLDCGHSQLIPPDAVSRIRARFTRRTRCDVCLEQLTSWHDDFGAGDSLDELTARRRNLRIIR